MKDSQSIMFWRLKWRMKIGRVKSGGLLTGRSDGSLLTSAVNSPMTLSGSELTKGIH